MLQKKDLLFIWSFLVSLQGLVFFASLQLISTYWVLVFGYVQNISIQKICMSHLLWWCCILLCFVMEMYRKWLDSTKCTEDVSWFSQMLLQNIRQLCSICCALNFPDCWSLAGTYLYLVQNKGSSHICLIFSAKSLQTAVTRSQLWQ